MDFQVQGYQALVIGCVLYCVMVDTRGTLQHPQISQVYCMGRWMACRRLAGAVIFKSWTPEACDFATYL
jgi:hypothetical protein